MPSIRQRASNTGRVPAQRKPRPTRQVNHLLDVLEYRDDGEAVTVGDRIIESIRHGLRVGEAAAAAGVGASCYSMWISQGAKLAKEQADIEAGVAPGRRLKQSEQGLLWFYQEVTQAKAEHERRLVTALDALATGEGLTTGTVTRKVEWVTQADGTRREVEVERKVTQANVLPNADAAKFLLRAAAPERWAGTDRLEVVSTGAVEHHHTHSVPVLEDMVAKLAEKIGGRDVVDTTADEIPALGPHSQPELPD